MLCRCTTATTDEVRGSPAQSRSVKLRDGRPSPTCSRSRGSKGIFRAPAVAAGTARERPTAATGLAQVGTEKKTPRLGTSSARPTAANGITRDRREKIEKSEVARF